jgi:CheY-like chemotaxis protein
MEIPPHTTTVLLIDPNTEDRQYWTERLRICSKDYTVVEADSAERGLTICKTERVDCVVTELHLPDMSGFLVLLRVNPIVRTLRMPVVVLSHLVLPLVITAAKRLGAQSYLIKSQASGDELDIEIKKAIAKVAPTRKERPAVSFPPSVSP